MNHTAVVDVEAGDEVSISSEVVKEGMSVSKQIGLIGTLLVMVLTFIGYGLRWTATELAKPWVDDQRQTMKAQQSTMERQSETLEAINGTLHEIKNAMATHSSALSELTRRIDKMEDAK